jgi:hypothetical protein
MANRSSKRLVRDDEPSQKTEKGLEMPVPQQNGLIVVLQKRSSLLRHPPCALAIIPTAMFT